jgi:hypothetical protein
MSNQWNSNGPIFWPEALQAHPGPAAQRVWMAQAGGAARVRPRGSHRASGASSGAATGGHPVGEEAQRRRL